MPQLHPSQRLRQHLPPQPRAKPPLALLQQLPLQRLLLLLKLLRQPPQQQLLHPLQWLWLLASS
jgi:hypothetical protein